MGGSLKAPLSLCSGRGASPLQRQCGGEEGPPHQPGEDSTQPLGLQRPPGEEGEAAGGSQGQEADLAEEGMWATMRDRAWEPQGSSSCYSFSPRLSDFNVYCWTVQVKMHS